MQSPTTSPIENDEQDQEVDRRPALFLLLALCTLFLGAYVLRMNQKQALEETILAQQEINAGVQAQYEELQNELANVGTAGWIDKEVRDKLGLAKEGDVPYMPVTPNVRPEEPLRPSASLIVQPIWMQWLDVIFPPGRD